MPCKALFVAILTIMLAGPLAGPALAEDAEAGAPAEVGGDELGFDEWPEVEDKIESLEEAQEMAFDSDLRARKLYQPGHTRVARPGGHPVSNFYLPPGFRVVDPSCYAGIFTYDAESWVPVFPEAKFYVNEQIRFHPTSAGNQFRQRFRWEVWSDPLEVMGITTTSSGAGGGTARVQLQIDRAHLIYRLVTDVRPRAGTYQITTTPGRTKTEDLQFAFADHHYAYIDTSGLQGPGADAALGEINRLVAEVPPGNVFMGFLMWDLNADASRIATMGIEDEETTSYGRLGKGQSRRELSVRITCPDVVGYYNRRFF